MCVQCSLPTHTRVRAIPSAINPLLHLHRQTFATGGEHNKAVDSKKAGLVGFLRPHKKIEFNRLLVKNNFTRNQRHSGRGGAPRQF